MFYLGVIDSVAEKAINGILDYVSAAADLDTALMQRFYEETLKCLTETKNEVRRVKSHAGSPLCVCECVCAKSPYTRLQRLSMKTNLKLAKLWLDRKEYDRLATVRDSPAGLKSEHLLKQALADPAHHSVLHLSSRLGRQ